MPWWAWLLCSIGLLLSCLCFYGFGKMYEAHDAATNGWEAMFALGAMLVFAAGLPMLIIGIPPPT